MSTLFFLAPYLSETTFNFWYVLHDSLLEVHTFPTRASSTSPMAHGVSFDSLEEMNATSRSASEANIPLEVLRGAELQTTTPPIKVCDSFKLLQIASPSHTQIHSLIFKENEIFAFKSLFTSLATILINHKIRYPSDEDWNTLAAGFCLLSSF